MREQNICLENPCPSDNRHGGRTFVIQPWFSFVCWYCRQHTTFVRSLHYFIIFYTCSYYVHRDCAQRKSVTSKILLVKYRLLVKFYYSENEILMTHCRLCGFSAVTIHDQSMTDRSSIVTVLKSRNTMTDQICSLSCVRYFSIYFK